MPKRQIYDKAQKLYMTGAMYARLVQVAGTQAKVNGTIREAIRLYLDEQEDLRMSRKHFDARLRYRLDRVDGALTALTHLLAVLALLLAHIGAVLINRLGDGPPVSGRELLEQARDLHRRGEADSLLRYARRRKEPHQ